MKMFVDTRVKPFRDRAGPYADGFLIFLSAISVGLVVINEFLPHKDFTLVLGLSWVDAQQLLRTFTWLAFVSVFLTMGFTSHRPMFWSRDPKKQSYLRKWWLEALICVCWIPFTGGVLIAQLHSLFSLQALLLIGSAAHVARISRYTAMRFNTHPLVTVGAAMATLVTFGSVLLMVVEPETFPNFHEAALSVYKDALTIGGDVKPQTLLGKDLEAIIATAEIGLLAVFFAVVREWVQYGIFKHDDINKIMVERMDAQDHQLDEQDSQIELLRHDNAELRDMVAALMMHAGIPPLDRPKRPLADPPIAKESTAGVAVDPPGDTP